MSDRTYEIYLKESAPIPELVPLRDVIALADKYDYPVLETMKLVEQIGPRRVEELLQKNANSNVSRLREVGKKILAEPTGMVVGCPVDSIVPAGELIMSDIYNSGNGQASPQFDPRLNPKHAAGAARPGTHYVPPTPLLEVGEVMKRGADKYGAYNWGEGGVVASVYYDAIERHRSKWWAGEEMSDDDKCHHLAHIAACALILLDCIVMGKLYDDRPARTSTPAEYAEWRKRQLGEASTPSSKSMSNSDKSCGNDPLGR